MNIIRLASKWPEPPSDKQYSQLLLLIGLPHDTKDGENNNGVPAIVRIDAGYSALNTALLGSVLRDDRVAAEAILLAGADANRSVDTSTGAGRTPSHFAAHKGSSEMLALLFDHGADLEKCDKVGRSPLHVACIFGNRNAVSFLLSCAVNIDGPDASLAGGNTALILAARSGHYKICRLLLEFGADSEIKNNSGMNALEVAKCIRPQTEDLKKVCDLFFSQSDEASVSDGDKDSNSQHKAVYKAIYDDKRKSRVDTVYKNMNKKHTFSGESDSVQNMSEEHVVSSDNGAPLRKNTEQDDNLKKNVGFGTIETTVDEILSSSPKSAHSSASTVPIDIGTSRMLTDDAGPAALFAAFWLSLAAVLIEWSMSLVGLSPPRNRLLKTAVRNRGADSNPTDTINLKTAEDINAEEERLAWQKLKDEELEMDRKYYSSKITDNIHQRSGFVGAFDGFVQSCINVFAKFNRQSIDHNNDDVDNDEVESNKGLFCFANMFISSQVCSINECFYFYKDNTDRWNKICISTLFFPSSTY